MASFRGKVSKITVRVVWLCVLVVQGVTGKTTTTKDTLIYEHDPGRRPTQLRLPPPGPSIFEYSHSDMLDKDSKVKRANVQPRYYEMVEDEVYVFEPSDMGMSPFMEAMDSDFRTPSYVQNNRLQGNGRRPPSPAKHQGRQNRPPKPSANTEELEPTNNKQYSPHPQVQDHVQHYQHHRNQFTPPPPPPRPTETAQSHQNHPPHAVPYVPHPQQYSYQTGNSESDSDIDIPFFQHEDIPVIERIPLLIPPPTSPGTSGSPQSSLFNLPFSSPPRNFPTLSPLSNESPPVSNDPSVPTEPYHSPQPQDNSVIPHGNHCTTSNDKQGQCVSFRKCYPVVFNSIDGQLQNPGLAKILFQAAGPCDLEDSNEPWTSQTKKEVIPGIVENDPDIPTDFFNQTICCATYYLSNNRYEHHSSSEPKTMRPSPPDPRKSPPEFQESQPTSTSSDSLYDDSFDVENSSSDYFNDEYDDYAFTTTEIPKLIPKNSSGAKTNASGTTETEEVKNPVSDTQANSESIQKEVKVGTTSLKKSKVTKKKVKSIQRDVSDSLKSHKNETDSNDVAFTNPSKPDGLVPFVMDSPELSAWECPGRKSGMPRGHWPWMVALLNDGNHFCSGSLIDHRHILTSSSCVAPFQGKDIGRLRVILGDRVLYSSVDGPHMWRNVVRIARHLQFDPVTMKNDIAVVEMEYPVSYTRTVQPINLPASTNHSHVTRGIVSGWSGADIGKQRFFAPRATIDSVAEFMDPDECQQQYSGFLGSDGPGDLLCTKPSTASCMADPGAPLMMKTNTCWHVIGVLSHGLRCGSFPDLFTDTAKYLSWIHKNIRHKPLA